MLGLEGYEVCQAGDCKAALKQLETQSPDVALCDVFLPDGNGVDLRNDKMLSRISLPPPNVCVRILPGNKDGLHFPGKYYSRELPCKEVARTRLYRGWYILTRKETW